MDSFYNLEKMIQLRPTQGGFTKAIPLSIDDAFNPGTAISLVATTTGTCGFVVESDGSRSVSWNATADQNDIAQVSFTLPEDANQPNGGTDLVYRPDMRFGFQLRKVDTTGSAADNTVQMTVSVYIQPPAWDKDGNESGDGTTRFILQKTFTLPAPTVLATTATRRWYYFTLSEIATDAQLNTITPGSKIDIRIAPGAAIGTALDVRWSGLMCFYKGHLKPTFSRWSTALSGIFK